MNSQQPCSQKVLFNDPTVVGMHRVVLEVQGIPPSFKNNRMVITKSPNGRPLQRPLLITKPEYQKAMEKITESFACQLLSACQTAGGGTLTGYSLASMIACSTPADDSLPHIPEIHVTTEWVEPGKEGCTILIERIK